MSKVDEGTNLAGGSLGSPRPATIALTRGRIALVDAGDYEFLSQYKWTAVLIGRKGYKYWSAQTKIGGRSVFMHRLIMAAPNDLQVDHKNQNTLDNQRSNLRLCTNSQNQANRPLSKRNTSGYRGVVLDRSVVKNIWRAQIRINRKRLHLGNFAASEDAARAYDEAARFHFGEFATLNFQEQI